MRACLVFQGERSGATRACVGMTCDTEKNEGFCVLLSFAVKF